jgi:hypothetical protein
MTGGVRAINSGTPFDHIEVDLQNALLAKKEFGQRHQCELRAFAKDRAAGSEEEVFYELLGDGGGSAEAAALQIVASSDLDLVPIEAMVLVEARVFRGDDSVLKIGLYLTERNKFIAFAVLRALSPGLQATLDLQCGGRGIDPAGRQKE